MHDSLITRPVLFGGHTASSRKEVCYIMVYACISCTVISVTLLCWRSVVWRIVSGLNDHLSAWCALFCLLCSNSVGASAFGMAINQVVS